MEPDKYREILANIGPTISYNIAEDNMIVDSNRPRSLGKIL